MLFNLTSDLPSPFPKCASERITRLTKVRFHSTKIGIQKIKFKAKGQMQIYRSSENFCDIPTSGLIRKGFRCLTLGITGLYHQDKAARKDDQSQLYVSIYYITFIILMCQVGFIPLITFSIMK
ncbi:hypothetical protein DT065_09575 [Salicibibacter kimchii]|uniref:Uncharacterized protein n=1 Tax=Salicibibacter kimchii TaxID=2099786 RepID=A0A345BZ59_9BACI|nr:hypothetical protein DT065_09575 [Salicibibacter kimchii]